MCKLRRTSLRRSWVRNLALRRLRVVCEHWRMRHRLGSRLSNLSCEGRQIAQRTDGAGRPIIARRQRRRLRDARIALVANCRGTNPKKTKRHDRTWLTSAVDLITVIFRACMGEFHVTNGCSVLSSRPCRAADLSFLLPAQPHVPVSKDRNSGLTRAYGSGIGTASVFDFFIEIRESVRNSSDANGMKTGRLVLQQLEVYSVTSVTFYTGGDMGDARPGCTDRRRTLGRSA